jgi:hypothetical protein
MEKPQPSSFQTRTTLSEIGDKWIITNPVEFQEDVSFLQLPETPISPAVGTTPSVLNNTKVEFSNGSPTDVTNLTGGQEGQTVFLFGDGNTTLKNNANLILGSDKLLEANTVTVLTQKDNKWYPLQQPSLSNFPAQTVSLPVGELHTVGAASTYEEYPNTQVWYRAICSLSAFTEFRVLYVTRNVNAPYGMTIRIEYSTNNSTWNTFWTSGSFTAAATALSSFAAIPVGAIQPTIYFRILVSAPNVGTDTVRLTTLQVQVR